jgi:hypothetical protein
MLVLSLVLIGLAITLEPIPLTAFILILASRGGVRKGAGFIFGWLVSLAVVIAVTVLVTGNNPPKPNTTPSLAALAPSSLSQGRGRRTPAGGCPAHPLCRWEVLREDPYLDARDPPGSSHTVLSPDALSDVTSRQGKGSLTRH